MMRIKQIFVLVFTAVIMTVAAACGGKAENGTGSKSIENGHDAEGANVRYFITCRTDTGSPVEGVIVQFCSGDSCQRAETGAGGLAILEAAPGEYDIEIQNIPEGYSVEGDTGFKTSKDKNNYRFTFSSAGCAVATEPAGKAATETFSTGAIVDEKTEGEKAGDFTPSYNKEKPRYMEKKYLDGIDMDGVKVVMINYWEPWCGYCIQEMPDLEALYQKYKDDGLLIVGMYEDTDGAEEVIKATGVTYPIVHLPQSSVYVPIGYPETVFIDNEGNVMTPDGTFDGEDEYGYCGYKSYEEWEKIILSKLGK